MKIEPNLFLIARTSVKPGMLEVPLQVPVGHFSLENQQAAGNGTGEWRWACIGEGGGPRFQGIEGGIGCLWDDNSSTRGGGRGGNFSRYRTSGHAFMGVDRHDWRTGVGPLVINSEILAVILHGEIKGDPQVDEPEIVRKILGKQPVKV